MICSLNYYFHEQSPLIRWVCGDIVISLVLVQAHIPSYCCYHPPIPHPLKVGFLLLVSERLAEDKNVVLRWISSSNLWNLCWSVAEEENRWTEDRGEGDRRMRYEAPLACLVEVVAVLMADDLCVIAALLEEVY